MAELALLTSTIAGISAFLATPVVGGLTIQELTIATIQIGTFCLMFLSRSSQLRKLTELLFFSIHNKTPSKKEMKDFSKMIYEIFKKHSKKELAQIYMFYKQLKPILFHINFDDEYFEKKKYKLISEPMEMKNYVLRKLYAENIHNLLLVKLYNATPSDENIKLLKNDIMTAFMNDNVDVNDIEKMALELEQKINEEYRKNKAKYDDEFKKEKDCLVNILKSMDDKKYNRSTRSSIRILSDIVNEAENEIVEPEKISFQLQLSNDLKSESEQDPRKRTNILDRLRG